TAILTAFYMMRVVLLTFFGAYRGHGHPHESPPSMTAPLALLAGLSVVVGFLGAPQLNAVFADWVHFSEEAHAEPFSYGFAAVSIIGALLGLLVGYRLYRGWRERDPVRRLGPFYTLLERKYYLDDVYLKGIVRPLQYPIPRAVDWTNQRVLDGAVNAAGWATRKLSLGVDVVDKRAVDGAVNGVAFGAGATGGLLRYIQSGNVQRYAVFLFVGVAILAIAITRF
ncbi:MAG: hypothetical protein LC722_08665, partial [Actinobacteria bacterium]|nr:hypothetical protein [Actinomycetota bacterium]